MFDSDHVLIYREELVISVNQERIEPMIGLCCQSSPAGDFVSFQPSSGRRGIEFFKQL
jgi:hypothetical protein